MANIGAGNYEPVGMNRIRRVWHQYGVTPLHGGQRKMRQPFLRPDGNDRLAVRIEFDVETASIPRCNCLPQARYAARDGIPVRIVAAGDFAQLVDNVTWRRSVRITHTEVDDILAAPTRLRLQVIDDIENVRWEPFDSRKIVHFYSGTAGVVVCAGMKVASIIGSCDVTGNRAATSTGAR